MKIKMAMRSKFINNGKTFLNRRFRQNWIRPDGVYTGITVYNCITKGKKPLILKNKNQITWYTCGPTVYDSSHIGHAACYVKLDVIQRILKDYFKFNLVTAMNITDIDDKIINKAQQSNRTWPEIARQYEEEFWTDLSSLGIQKPYYVLRVTENIDLIINFIERLVNNGQAYKVSDNSVYFNVDRCKGYGKLHNIGTENFEQEPNNLKKSSVDFALWKGSKKDEPCWDSPWGSGRPGWHTECSAIASHIFGSNIDVHAGGVDLRFPHHENEEAQSCAFHGSEQWVNNWIHTGHLHLKDSEKMSKSLKNTISIQDMLKDTRAEAFRLACVMSHYRNNMEYCRELMDTAENLLKVFQNFQMSCSEYEKGYLKGSVNDDLLKKLFGDSVIKIDDAFCDDFDTPSVLKTLHHLVSTTNAMMYSSASNANSNPGAVKVVHDFVQKIFAVLGVPLRVGERSTNVYNEGLAEVVDILVSFRQDVRESGLKSKDQVLLKLCDGVRDRLKEVGVIVKDHGRVSSWSR